MVLLAILIGVVFFVLAIVIVAYTLKESSDTRGITERDFDEEYEKLGAETAPGAPDEKAAWRDFRTWFAREHNAPPDWTDEEGSAE